MNSSNPSYELLTQLNLRPHQFAIHFLSSSTEDEGQRRSDVYMYKETCNTESATSRLSSGSSTSSRSETSTSEIQLEATTWRFYEADVDFTNGRSFAVSSLWEKGARMRPVFVGNFEYETRKSELERLFSKYGRVDRVDMKSGFAFVYFEDERDAQDAIHGLDNRPFGYDRRRLSVEWAKGERGRHHDGSKSLANQRPTKTLFVINFDPLNTKVHDIERHFEPYGKVLHVRIRRNFAFVQFETQEEATKALQATHLSKILDRVVSVEYALRDDGERGDRYRDSPRRSSYGRHGDSPYGRSPSPAYRRRPSPDYGRPHSPAYDRYNAPVYDRRRSPNYGRNESPEYARRYRSRSPLRR